MKWKDWNSITLNRREFFQDAGIHAKNAAVASLLSAPLVPNATQAYYDTILREHSIERTKLLGDLLREKYGVEVVTDLPIGEVLEETDDRLRYNITIRELESDWMRFKVLERMQELLSVYPPALIRGRLKTFYVGREVSTNVRTGTQENVGGIAFRSDGDSRFRNLVVTIPQDFLAAYRASFGNAISALSTHHELAHVLSLQNANTMDEWEALAEENKTEERVYIYPSTTTAGAPSGFITQYAASAAHEDFAEMSKYLFTNSSTRQELWYRASQDKLVDKKLNYLLHWYERESGGLMNRQYWEDLMHGRVHNKYWGVHSKGVERQ